MVNYDKNDDSDLIKEILDLDEYNKHTEPKLRKMSHEEIKEIHDDLLEREGSDTNPNGPSGGDDNYTY